MTWLRRLFSPFPWDQADVEGRLRPVAFRVATAEDFPFCQHLHELNEQFGVPAEDRSSYAAALRSGGILTLIVEEGGTPVATCGIHWTADDVAFLCYGMVHPSRHRCGIGTTMLIARIALLPVPAPDQVVALAALDSSVEFYRRFGFRTVRRVPVGGFHCSVAVIQGVHSRIIEGCRDMILRVGGRLPNAVIPVCKQPARDA